MENRPAEYPATLDKTDWSAFTTAQRMKHLEIEGYSLFPALLDPAQVQAIKAELDRLPTIATDYVEVPDWEAEKVATLPPHVRRLFKSLNTSNFDFNVPNRPANMANAAPGINPSRWDV